MDEYRRQLERTEIKICVILLVLLFGGVSILPWIGQVIWIAVIAAIYIRLTLVIARREELVEKHSPTQRNERSTWFHARKRRILISDTKGTRALSVDPTTCARKHPLPDALDKIASGNPAADTRARRKGQLNG